ncbi:enterotoxin [Staphylococcus sp. HMSC036D05]|uniref:lanthionine synthetase C family protein n=1 Tax=Staphylococcus sp. HMSC036D05 TaxID=1715059 RepID=UPI0008A9A0CB|nr:lanthionine synthetase C family protein [Staphylococcus sp. HMSC036D05]OHO72011.1 enterotoxin [Staphylococcus sp. HMSC036D05]
MKNAEALIKKEVEFLSQYEIATAQIENNSEYWSSYTLSHGYPGIILFLNEYQKNFRINLDELIHKYILRIGEELERRIEGYSLFSGISGIAFSIDIVSDNSTHYQTILQKLDNYLIDFINRKMASINIEANPKKCDVVQGLAGVGRYLLNRVWANPKVVTSLIDIMKYFRDLHYSKNHWIISKENQFLNIDKERYSSGNINLGLAHGILGPFSLLALSKLKGIELNNHISLLSDITDYLFKSEFQNECGWLDRYDIAEMYYPSYAIRNGWCYGDTGVMNTIWLLGMAQKDEELIEKAKNIMIKIIRLNNDNLISPTFCHGLASHFTILNNVNRYFNIEEVNNYLNLILDKILSYYSSENQFMFHDIEIVNSQTRFKNKVGLLEGQIGILLSLLDYQNSQSNALEKSWKNMFLIS